VSAFGVIACGVNALVSIIKSNAARR